MSSIYQITGSTAQNVTVVSVHVAGIDQEVPDAVPEIGIVNAIRTHLLSLPQIGKVTAVRTTRVQTQV